jgi:hypothetical protein
MVILVLFGLKNKVGLYWLLVFAFFIFFEYVFSPLNIRHTEAPEEVYNSYGGRFMPGILCWSLFSVILLLKTDFTRRKNIFSNVQNFKFIEYVFWLYYVLVLFSAYNSGLFSKMGGSVSVNGHSYFLVSTYILWIILKSLSGYKICFRDFMAGAFLVFLVLFLLKTRGVAILALGSWFFCIKCMHNKKIRSSFFIINGFRVAAALSVFLTPIAIIYLGSITNPLGNSFGLFSKDLGGLRGIVALSWIDYTISVLTADVVAPPVFTPHNSFVGAPLQIGWLYFIFLIGLFSNLVIKMVFKERDIFSIIIFIGFVVVMYTAETSLLRNPEILFSFIMLRRFHEWHRFIR